MNEYDVRRKMLLKRLDVTVQSFGWSERAKVGLDLDTKSLHMVTSVGCNVSFAALRKGVFSFGYL